MLDYAANALPAYWPVETKRARFEAGCEAQGGWNEGSGFLAWVAADGVMMPVQQF